MKKDEGIFSYRSETNRQENIAEILTKHDQMAGKRYRETIPLRVRLNIDAAKIKAGIISAIPEAAEMPRYRD